MAFSAGLLKAAKKVLSKKYKKVAGGKPEL